MTLYGLAACDTCRKALKSLRESGRNVTFVDIRATPLPPAAIARFHAAFGADLVNRRSRTWRDLPASARGAGAEELIAAHPALMKRPVIDDGGTLRLGWPAAS